MAGMAPDPLSATRERLRRLEQLRTEGILTDEGCAAKRAAIVDDVIAVPVSNAPHPEEAVVEPPKQHPVNGSTPGDEREQAR